MKDLEFAPRAELSEVIATIASLVLLIKVENLPCPTSRVTVSVNSKAFTIASAFTESICSWARSLILSK